MTDDGEPELSPPPRRVPRKAAKVIKLVQKSPEELRRSRSGTLTSVGVSRFCAEYLPLSYIVEPIIRGSTIYTLTAATGTGKTAWMIAAALAVATGRSDILGLEVQGGRVLYIGLENPDDLRMRVMVAAQRFGVDLGEVNRRLLIIDRKASPEDILMHVSEKWPRDYTCSLILVDTLAAWFDGRDVNDAVDGGGFIRRARQLTELPGLPAVVIAAHPVKGARDDTLIPYGSGAILNEVDGNLTLFRRPQTNLVTLGWQGKFRGPDFQPVGFCFRTCTSPVVLDDKGREVELPILVPQPIEATSSAPTSPSAKTEDDLLKAMRANPTAGSRHWAGEIRKSPALVHKVLQSMERRGLVEKAGRRWSLQPQGLAK